MKFKTLFLALIVAIFTIGIFAEDASAGFDPYLSVRIQTLWNAKDKDLAGEADGDLQYDMMGSSRFGAKGKVDNVDAQGEVSINGGGIGIRQAWVNWDSGSGIKVLVGWTEQPYQKYSNNCFNDAPAIGIGGLYDRSEQIKLQHASGVYAGIMKTQDDTGAASVDITLPRIAVGWGGKAGPLNLTIGAAYNTVKVDDVSDPNDGESLASYLIHVGGDTKMGTIGFAFNFGYGTNFQALGLVSTNGASAGTGLAVVDYSADGAPGGGWDDTTCMEGFAEVRLFMPGKVINIGLGYASADHETGSEADTAMEIYVNAIIDIDKHFQVTPQFIYRDYGNNSAGVAEGTEWWAGLKWQAQT